MDAELKEETRERESSVVSSEASSQFSISSGIDYEAGVINNELVLKKKSSSLSCLPDHIRDFDNNTFTLPPNLDAVKPFVENSLRKGASTARSCYETALCLEQLSDEESTSGDQRSALEQNNSKSDIHEEVTNGTDYETKQDVELQMNTSTHTYVRKSALNILSKFPKTETVSSMESGSKCPELKVVQEDGQDKRNDNTDGALSGSKSADHLSGKKEVSSWSSSNNVKSKHRKKGMFKNNKKVKAVASESRFSEQSHDTNQVDAKAEKKKTGKEKTKSTQYWLKILRGKNAVAQGKGKKERKPVQKSQSFCSTTSLPRSSQLNRMDSFRKLFKRPRRDSVPSTEGKSGENVRKHMEITGPTPKPNLRPGLVDREEFLRQRAYQLDKTKTKKERTSVDVSDVKATNNHKNSDPSINNDNSSNASKDKIVVTNGFEDSDQGSPVAPIRHKHIQRKKRLSLLAAESDDKDICNDSNNSKSDGQGEEIKVQLTTSRQSNEEPAIETECKDDVSNYDASLADDESLASIKVILNESFGLNTNPSNAVNLDELQVAQSDVNNELQKVVLDKNENLSDVIVRSLPRPSSLGIAQNTSPPQETRTPESASGQSENLQLSLESYSQSETLYSPASGQSENLYSPASGQSESEFEEVFVDCINDESIFVDRATRLENKSQATSEGNSVEGTSMLAQPKWKSEVSTSESQRAIETAKKVALGKKPASFSGVRTSPPMNLTNTPNGARSPPVQTSRRTSSTFRIPSASFRFEPAASEPISLITDMVPVTFPNFLTDRRSQIVLELFTTERTYVRGLETMIELFKKPMLTGRMDEKDVDAVFSNLNDIFAVNKDLLFLLWEKVKHWTIEQCIAQMFIDMEERFKIYATYCKNFDRADSLLKQKIKKNKEFERFLKACYQDPLCQPGLDLPAYLITIVQRIPRYLLLLKSLFKKTPSSHPDYNTLQTALTRMDKVAEYINSQLQEVHGKKAMQELRSTVIGLKAYEVKGRTLLKEAEVCLMSPKKPYKCLLFNDIMVFAVQGAKDRSEIEMTLELKTLWFEDLKKLDPQTSKCDAIELYTPQRPYTMYACSRTDKRVWLQKLRTAIVTLLYGPDCEDPDGMDISRRKASDTYFDGSVYCGEYVNGKRHGQGVMAWPNRTRYEGSWADDERHGHGQLTYYTGEKYVGNWVADKKEGEGRQTYVNNDVYHGTWKDGKMHGKGEINFANGDRYVGDMFNNEVEGNGEMTCTSGLIYKGEWKKSMRYGVGHMFLPNRNEYKGEFLNDRICGSGTMTYFNGDQYSGEWVNEQRHGSGDLKLVNGTVYHGQWNNDFMNGQGRMTYPNGDEYDGTWFQNKRVGKGQLMYAHGDTYDGQWQADTMHGKGVMYYKDGSIYEGDWDRGEPHGHGKTVYKDKRMYEGEYDHGVRHGRGQLIYPNNVLYVGEWRWDKFDGSGVFNDPNTDYSYTGDWSCGMRDGHGKEISYRTQYDGNWKADMKHGQGEERSHAGHVFKGTWKENRKHGDGIRTLRSKVQEAQQWYEGHLVDGGETVAEGLPPLPRR